MIASLSASLLLLLHAVAALPQPPHIFFVLVDDLGFANVGFNRNEATVEVKTPVIDDLAHRGVILSRNYVHYVCTPSRSSIQSGRLPVHVTISLETPDRPTCGIPRNMTGMAAKLKAAPVPYATHYVGKWDAGMATPFHTPEGRGYDTTLNYFNHKNDFWTQQDLQSTCKGKVYDLWEANKTAGNSGGAPAKRLQGTMYEEFMFEQQMLKVIANHDAAQPLFLFYAPHVAHFPLQVPEDYFNAEELVSGPGDESSCAKATGSVWPGNHNKYSCRRQYHAMVSLLDRVIGNVTTALKAKGMWDNLLMVFTSDNGGQNKWPNAGGNNFPLKGGKYSPWEGGIRVAAFVSGGFIPSAVRGSRNDGIVHGSDWYATFCKLAGIDATDEWAKASGLPPVDGLDVWPMISTNGKSPHEQVPLPIDENTLILGDWKLLRGKVTLAEYTGPHYPNATSGKHQISGHSQDCSHGCLYRVGVSNVTAGEDVVADTEERNDVSKLYPERVTAMTQALMTAKKSFYTNHDQGHNSPACRHMNGGSSCGCYLAEKYYGGFYGPYQEVDPRPEASLEVREVEANVIV